MEAQSEIDRLRRENAELRRLLGPRAPLSEASDPGTYRVSAPGVKVALGTRTVRSSWVTRDPFFTAPSATYDVLDLFLHEAGGDGQKITEAAWRRYVKSGVKMPPNQFGAQLAVDAVRDRGSFEITANVQYADAVELPANSEAHAFELFRSLTGMLEGSHAPHVQKVS